MQLVNKNLCCEDIDMPLKLYIGLEQIAEKNKIIKFNDIWFQDHIKEIKYGEPEREIVKCIDNVVYEKDRKFKSKFMADTLFDASELSAGCKTALNIHTFTDKIFNIAGCGNNALQLIMNMKQGNAYIDNSFMTESFNNEIIVYIEGKEFYITTDDELYELMEGFFNAKHNFT